MSRSAPQRTNTTAHVPTRCCASLATVAADARPRWSSVCVCVWIVLDHSVSTHKDGWAATPYHNEPALILHVLGVGISMHITDYRLLYQNWSLILAPGVEPWSLGWMPSARSRLCHCEACTSFFFVNIRSSHIMAWGPSMPMSFSRTTANSSLSVSAKCCVLMCVWEMRDCANMIDELNVAVRKLFQDSLAEWSKALA